jgi:hypothetical protein
MRTNHNEQETYLQPSIGLVVEMSRKQRQKQPPWRAIVRKRGHRTYDLYKKSVLNLRSFHSDQKRCCDHYLKLTAA